MTTTLTGHVVGIGFGRLDPDADEDNAWIDDGHTYVTVRLDNDNAAVPGGRTTITLDEPAAEHMNPERPARTNADVSRISAEPSDAEVQAAARAMDGYDSTVEGVVQDWEGLTELSRQHYLGSARAALLAARKVAGR